MSDTMIAGNPRAVAGGNNPPLSPYEAVAKTIDDLYAECGLWLDGAVVDSQSLADGIGNLIALLRAAATKADAARIAEKKPLDEQIEEIQSRYNLLIGDTKKVKGKAIRAIEACKAALQPWLDAERRRIDAEARKAREEAEAATRRAQEAIRAADAANLAEREKAEELIQEAKRADAVATKASKQTAMAGGQFGRSVSLRTEWVTEITDARAFARYVWSEHHDEIASILPEIAKRLVAQGKREMPGCIIAEMKKAV